MSSSCKMVKIKKKKKGFIENEVVFTDDEMEIDSTLKNNIGENLEKVQEDDLNISKLIDSSDKDEVFDTDKKIQEMRSTIKGIFMQPDVHDGRDVSSKHDVHSSGDSLSCPPPTYIGGMKIDNRVLDLEKKHCCLPGWRGRSIFPIDNRSSGEHCDVIQKMTTGSTKDRQLLEVLEEVITRNKEEYEIDNGNNEDLEGELEHADDDDDDDDIENENTNENKVDKSHSLDLESQQDSHTETDGYGDSNEETCRQQVTSPKITETDSIQVEHDVCTKNHDGENDKESDSVVTSTVVDQCDGQGNTDNLIVIEPSEAKQEVKQDSINSDSINTDSTNKHYVYDMKTGMAYDIRDLDLSSFNQLFSVDAIQTPSGVQHRVTQIAIATPDTTPPDITTTEKPLLTNIPVVLTPERPAAPTTDHIPTTEKPLLTNIQVVVTPEKPAAPTTDNIPSPQAGEVHVLKMIVEDVDFDDVKVKKEPCSDDDNISSESDAKTNDKKRDEQPNIRECDGQLNQNDNEKRDGKDKVSERSVQPNIRERDGQLNQNDNEKRDGQDKVSGRDGEKHNKPDEGKDKDDSIVTDADKQASEEKKFDVDENKVSGQRDGEEDPLIENDENKPDNKNDGQKAQEEEVIDNVENKPDDAKDGKKPQEDEVIENEEKPDDERDGQKLQENEVIDNEENKPDDEKDGKKPQEDEVIENEEKPDDKKDGQNFQEDEVIENKEKKGDDEKDKEDSVLKGKVIEQCHGHDNEEEEEKNRHDDVTEENDGVIELRDGHDKEEETKHDVTKENEGVIQQRDGHDKEEEEKKSDVTQEEAHVVSVHDGHDKEEEEKKSDVTQKEAHVDSGGQQPQVDQISAQQFYKRTQTLSRAVRKQEQED